MLPRNFDRYNDIDGNKHSYIYVGDWMTPVECLSAYCIQYNQVVRGWRNKSIFWPYANTGKTVGIDVWYGKVCSRCY